MKWFVCVFENFSIVELKRNFFFYLQYQLSLNPCEKNILNFD